MTHQRTERDLDQQQDESEARCPRLPRPWRLTARRGGGSGSRRRRERDDRVRGKSRMCRDREWRERSTGEPAHGKGRADQRDWRQQLRLPGPQQMEYEHQPERRAENHVTGEHCGTEPRTSQRRAEQTGRECAGRHQQQPGNDHPGHISIHGAPCS